ncbi:MAG: porin [Deltaproteobacteria bacterium]|nr:porin [Deltaproteobacteria bacterium]
MVAFAVACVVAASGTAGAEPAPAPAPTAPSSTASPAAARDPAATPPAPPAPAPSGPGASAPAGSLQIPGTNTTLAIGGMIKLDVLFSSTSVGGAGGSNAGDQFLLPSAIPVGSQGDENGQITFHARASRFFFKTDTPTEWGTLGTYIECDFFQFAAPGDERVSNGYAPRGPARVRAFRPATGRTDLEHLHDRGGAAGGERLRRSGRGGVRASTPASLVAAARRVHPRRGPRVSRVDAPHLRRQAPDTRRRPDPRPRAAVRYVGHLGRARHRRRAASAP